VDLVLLDAAINLSLPVLKLLEPSLNEGAIIVCDNAESKEYIEYVRNPHNGYLTQPFPIKGEGYDKELTLVTQVH
jgi:predicted O-methyltransferase YrrM